MRQSIIKGKDRDALKPRREPYWHRLQTGCYLGFRKSDTGPGAWIARWRIVELDQQRYHALGAFDHLPQNERFDAASKAAGEWFNHLAHGGSTEVHTVKDACNLYVEMLERKKRDNTAKDSRRRFEKYVFNLPLAKVQLPKLTAQHVKKWREALEEMPSARGTPRTDATINRDMVALRAALNHAYKERLVTTDMAWRGALDSIEAATGTRELYLERGQRAALINAAGFDLVPFLKALCALPIRPGAMSDLTVGDFNRELGTLCIRKDKAGAGRTIKLPKSMMELFMAQIRHKLSSVYIFTRYDGAKWTRDTWKVPVRRAVQAAGLPEETTLYHLRHAVITDLVNDGTDLATVAKLAGTSLKMINDTYHHLQQDAAADALERVAL